MKDDPYLMNRVGNSHNIHQGGYKRVLCVCSAGLLRSPTAAIVLSSPPFNFNTRAAGLTPQFALVPVDEVLLQWAQEIVCMDQVQQATLIEMALKLGIESPVFCLGIRDVYKYRDKSLMEMIEKRYKEETDYDVEV